MSLTHLPASASPEEVTALIRKDGACIVDSVLSAAEMDLVATELEPYIAATKVGPDDFAGHNTRRTGGLVGRSPRCRDLVMHPLVLGTAGKLLGHSTSFTSLRSLPSARANRRRPFTAINGRSISFPSRKTMTFSATPSGR